MDGGIPKDITPSAAVKQEKNDVFLPTARHCEKDEGRGEKRVLARL